MLPEELKYTKEHEWVKFDGDFIFYWYYRLCSR